MDGCPGCSVDVILRARVLFLYTSLCWNKSEYSSSWDDHRTWKVLVLVQSETNPKSKETKWRIFLKMTSEVTRGANITCCVSYLFLFPAFRPNFLPVFPLCAATRFLGDERPGHGPRSRLSSRRISSPEIPARRTTSAQTGSNTPGLLTALVWFTYHSARTHSFYFGVFAGEREEWEECVWERKQQVVDLTQQLGVQQPRVGVRSSRGNDILPLLQKSLCFTHTTAGHVLVQNWRCSVSWFWRQPLQPFDPTNPKSLGSWKQTKIKDYELLGLLVLFNYFILCINTDKTYQCPSRCFTLDWGPELTPGR